MNNRQCSTCEYFSEEFKPIGYDGVCKFDSNEDRPVMKNGYSSNYKFKSEVENE